MGRSKESIYWSPELTDEAKEMSVKFLAELFAPIIRSRIEEEAKRNIEKESMVYSS